MKQNKKSKIFKVMLLVLIIAIIGIVVTVTANTGNIRDELTLVKMAALISKGTDANSKVSIDVLTEKLETYTGPGKINVTEKSSNTLLVKFLETGREYEVDVNIGIEGGNVLPNTANTSPYMPTGFRYVEGDLNTGLVIADASNNEYVWIEVPRTAAVYSNAGLNINAFTDEEFALIETDLNTYSSAYGNSAFSDTYSSQDATGLTSEQYTTLKQKMLKSVYKNGGFYIGRYEAGIEINRITHSEIDNALVPKSQKNQYPLTRVYCSEAQILAGRVATTGTESSLMFGVQWNLVLKYLETKGATEGELKGGDGVGSTNWGNYRNSKFILNRGKYAQYGYENVTAEWRDYTTDLEGIVENSEKQPVTDSYNSIFYTTGASDQNQKQNIYDFAGNAWEWTLEYSGDETSPCVERGGYGFNPGELYPADTYANLQTTEQGGGRCFRVTLFKDEGTRADLPSNTLPSTAYTTPYLPSADFAKLEGTDLSTGLVIQDGSGNQYVWIEVPRTTAVYDNLNYDLDELSGTDLTNAYNAIYTDLKEYTTTYRNGTSYDDIHSGNDESTGLTSTQYTEKKNKMLKSVYENGGFYIGRYEAGIDTNRTSHSTISETLVPTSKENQYPLTYVYCSEAQTLASRVLPTGGSYTSSLMFGVQWDLVLKYLETKNAATQTQLNTDSTTWGNYMKSTYTLNRGKYAQNGNLSAAWKEYTTDLTGIVESSVKQSATSTSNCILYTTGASDQNRKQNIYDLAGNVWEWTLEHTSDSSKPCVPRSATYASLRQLLSSELSRRQQ